MPRKPMVATTPGSMLQDLSLSAIMNVFPQTAVRRVLKETQKESLRKRLLPAEVVLYLIILLAFYSEASIRESLRILIEPLRRKFGLAQIDVATGAAITKDRRRLGTQPLVHLFEQVAKPCGTHDIPGCFYRKLRVVAVDATTVELQDTPANRLRFGRHDNQHGLSGHSLIKAVLLLECGTRMPLGCAWGGGDDYEPGIFDPLRERLALDMLLLADRAYYSFERWQGCAERAGALLWRVKNNLGVLPLQALSDGSYLAEIRPSHTLIRQGKSRREERAKVRVIEYRTVFEDGTEGEKVRLLTTLLDAQAMPAEELCVLYAQRWEAETGFDELKTHLRGPHRVLRSQVPELVEQELYGFLLAYSVVRLTMLEAAKRERSNPKALSFVHALRVIRRRLSFPPTEPA